MHVYTYIKRNLHAPSEVNDRHPSAFNIILYYWYYLNSIKIYINK